MPRPRATRSIPQTDPFDFIYGRYHLSQWCIPYFFTNMTLRQAADSLKRVDEFPGVEHVNWRLEELYQRDVDWTRVERQIVPYLRATAHPQFFNALTVALLPMHSGGVLASFDSDGWQPPEIDDASSYGKLLEIGPITCAYYDSWANSSEPGAKLGKIRWNSREVFSVAIDGQHRLAAIKKIVESSGASQGIDESQVPVILLVFDPRVGYDAPCADGDLVDVLRVLFTDLNKHAVPVSRSRQILLDDRDPHSLCVRALVGERLLDGKADLLAERPRLPLSLVDWHSDQARFDRGPYLATILGLDWMVTRVLGTKPIRDYMDYKQVRRQIKAFCKALAINLDEAEQRLRAYEDVKQQPFRYSESSDNDELSTIVDAFATIWVPPLVKLLTEFSPYQELIEERAATSALSTEFVTWYYMYQRKEDEDYHGEATSQYGSFIQKLASRDEGPIGEHVLLKRLEDVQSVKQLEDGETANFAFNVVFQKAYVAAFVEFMKIEESHVAEIRPEDADEYDDLLEGEDPDDDETEYDEVNVPEADTLEEDEDRLEDDSELEYKASFVAEQTDVYVAAMNAFVECQPEFLSKDCPFAARDEENPFWLGTLLTGEGNIDFTMAAAGRAKELLFWIAVIYLLRKNDDELCADGFDEFWSKLNESNARIHRSMRRSVSRFMKEDRGSAAMRILRDKYTREAAEEEAYWRLQWMWDSLATSFR